MPDDNLPVRFDPPQALPVPIVNVDLVGAFLAGRNPRTLRAYQKDLEDFGRFLGHPPALAVELLLTGGAGQANAAALAYKAHLTDRKLSAATIGRRLAALRSLVKLAKTVGRVSWTLEIPSPKSEALRDTAGPGDTGWRAVLELVKTEAAGGTPIAVRNLALVRMLHDLGLRRGEVESIDLADVDLEGGTVSVVGKGRTEAVKITLPDPVRKALAGWIAVRGDHPGALFQRLDRAAGAPDRLSADGIHKIVGELGRKAGLSRPLRPHGLRHRAITTVLDRNNGDVRAAQRFSRHKDLRTLCKYDDNRADLGGQMARLISEE